MIKILIADDELPIREWMEFVLSRLPAKLEIVGTASNGQDALKLFEAYHPDLIFTDIKMPVMDGIALLEAVKKNSKNVTVVMLTSHTDFEYAKNSLNLGADHFLLKTEIDSKVLLEIIEKCSSKVSYQDSMQTDSPDSQTNDIFYTPEDCTAFCEQHIAKLKAPFFLLSLFRKDKPIFTTFIYELCEANDANLLFLDDFSPEISVCAISSRETPSQIYQLNQYTILRSKLDTQTGCKLGISELLLSSRKLNIRLLNTILALNLAFFYPERTLCPQVDFEKNIRVKDSLNRLYRSAIARKADGNSPGILTLSTEMLDIIEKNSFTDIAYIRQIFSDMVEHCRSLSFGYSIHSLDSVCDNAKRQILYCNTFTALKEAVLIFGGSKEIKYWEQFDGYSQYVRTAITEVWNNYDKIEKSTDISKLLSLNNEYFCRLFKTETGISFNKFLNDHRLSVAEHLLKNTDKKISEIASAVGYHNLSYFSKMYKQAYGDTPFKYRKN